MRVADGFATLDALQSIYKVNLSCPICFDDVSNSFCAHFLLLCNVLYSFDFTFE